MTHWLEIVRTLLPEPDETVTAQQALIIGDPAHRAANLCDRAGMQRVHVAIADSTATRTVAPDVNDQVVQIDAGVLPFADESFDLVIVQGTLEFVHDDRQMVSEFVRVLTVGGQLLVRLPFRGFLDGLDALNLYRYTRELTGHGDIPPEALPIGWRRHYGVADLDAVFDRPDLSPYQMRRGGLALGELAYWPGLVLTRSIFKRDEAAHRLRRVYARLGDIDERFPGPATVTVTSQRIVPRDR